MTGVFTVTRGQSFAGHSLADIATTGGSGAFLVGLNQFWGYLAFGAGAAAFMEMIGIQRRRGRDVATGVVLGAALGLAALFLYLGTQYSTTTGASFTILFGSIFVITPSTVPALIVSALLALATVIALARVLLLSSLSPDLAAARGGYQIQGEWLERWGNVFTAAVLAARKRPPEPKKAATKPLPASLRTLQVMPVECRTH